MAFILPLFFVVLAGRSQPFEAKKEARNTQPSLTATASLQQHAAEHVEDEQKRHIDGTVRVISSPPKDVYDKAAFWVNICLAIVGVGGICVAVCSLAFIKKQTGEMRLQRIVFHNTLSAIKRQADTMEGQAEDARQASADAAITTAATVAALNQQADAMEAQARNLAAQTEHLIATERPFLMIEVRDNRTPTSTYAFIAKNYGRSPAQLVFTNNTPYVRKCGYDDKMTDKPDYGYGYNIPGMSIFNEPWIPPGGEYTIGTIGEDVIKLYKDSAREDISNGPVKILIYGAIRYKGRFSTLIFDSKYSYMQTALGLRMSGPYGWNDYT